MRRGPILAVCCALLLVLAGCSGAGNSAGGDAAQTGGSVDVTAEATAAADAESGEDGGSDGGVRAQAAERDLIYEATVRLRVDDFDAARADIAETARERGGYVGDSSRQVNGEGNRTWTAGRIVLRVPTGNYSGALSAVEERGEVRSSEQSVRDVTDQVVDLEARLESLRAERDRLRELYEDANDTEEVLAVQRELSDVQTEIERTEARLRSLEDRVAYATITVELREPAPDPEPVERTSWYDTPVTEAFLQSVDGVIVLGRSLVVLTAYALPFLLVASVPLAGVALGVRYLRNRRRGP
ncbi:DUF4349 domain-containing protein [Halobaculum sp. CBA1158]|uniref:DUF4349 domain-containing protein n=1 Tax=Halobaculum sp. CBA1158 TaxID=2904243 RepID=UPI001F3DCB9E|nr:DUF4349 domain-containing protein [Halobaculum sp. CBA1158]UIO99347.1 DUF4349 domain-containing protein [Halobaculum sp. CBA1158]